MVVVAGPLLQGLLEVRVITVGNMAGVGVEELRVVLLAVVQSAHQATVEMEQVEQLLLLTTFVARQNFHNYGYNQS